MRVHSFFLTGRKTCPGHDLTPYFPVPWPPHFWILPIHAMTAQLVAGINLGSGVREGFLQEGVMSELNVEVNWRVLRGES